MNPNDPLASIDAAAKAASVCSNRCDTNTTIAAIRAQANGAVLLVEELARVFLLEKPT